MLREREKKQTIIKIWHKQKSNERKKIKNWIFCAALRWIPYKGAMFYCLSEATLWIAVLLNFKIFYAFVGKSVLLFVRCWTVFMRQLNWVDDPTHWMLPISDFCQWTFFKHPTGRVYSRYRKSQFYLHFIFRCLTLTTFDENCTASNWELLQFLWNHFSSHQQLCREMTLFFTVFCFARIIIE